MGDGSLPSREAWIEIVYAATAALQAMSLPSREAWIEIGITEVKSCGGLVASLAGSVD